jgi:DNA-binding CsgD family transcriptional regulator
MVQNEWTRIKDFSVGDAGYITDKSGIFSRLSGRERTILMLSVQGHTDDAIGHRLGIARSTVLTYWSRIRAKVGPLTRSELAALVGEQAAVNAMRKAGTLGDETARRALDSLIALHPDPVLYLDSNGKVTSIHPGNRRATWLACRLGRVGTDWIAAIPFARSPEFAVEFAGKLSAPQPSNISWPADRDGVDVLVDVKLIPSGSGTVVVLSLPDVV